MKYTLPNGQTVELPDDANPDKKLDWYRWILDMLRFYLKGLQDKVDKNAADIKDLQDKIKDLENQIANVINEINNLQQQINNINKIIGDGGGGSDGNGGNWANLFGGQTMYWNQALTFMYPVHSTSVSALLPIRFESVSFCQYGIFNIGYNQNTSKNYRYKTLIKAPNQTEVKDNSRQQQIKTSLNIPSIFIDGADDGHIYSISFDGQKISLSVDNGYLSADYEDAETGNEYSYLANLMIIGKRAI